MRFYCNRSIDVQSCHNIIEWNLNANYTVFIHLICFHKRIYIVGNCFMRGDYTLWNTSRTRCKQYIKYICFQYFCFTVFYCFLWYFGSIQFLYNYNFLFAKKFFRLIRMFQVCNYQLRFQYIKNFINSFNWHFCINYRIKISAVCNCHHRWNTINRLIKIKGHWFFAKSSFDNWHCNFVGFFLKFLVSKRSFFFRKSNLVWMCFYCLIQEICHSSWHTLPPYVY